MSCETRLWDVNGGYEYLIHPFSNEPMLWGLDRHDPFSADTLSNRISFWHNEINAERKLNKIISTIIDADEALSLPNNFVASIIINSL